MIIKPHRYTDVNNNFLKYTSFVIKILLESNKIRLFDLYEKFFKKSKMGDIRQFILVLDFLYCLDKINYLKENDIIELKK